MSTQAVIPDPVAAHRCGRLCVPDAHMELLWLPREKPRVIAVKLRLQYRAAGIRLVVVAPAPHSVVTGHPRIPHDRGQVAWLVGWSP